MHEAFFFHNTYGIGDINELQKVTNKLINSDCRESSRVSFESSLQLS